MAETEAERRERLKAKARDNVARLLNGGMDELANARSEQLRETQKARPRSLAEIEAEANQGMDAAARGWDSKLMAAEATPPPQAPLSDAEALERFLEGEGVLFSSVEQIDRVRDLADRQRYKEPCQILRDLREAHALSASVLLEMVSSGDVENLLYKSTWRHLHELATQPGNRAALTKLRRIGAETWGADLPQDGPGAQAMPGAQRPNTEDKVGYVYAMLDEAVGGLLKIGYTYLHPEVRLHQLNRDTSRVYPMHLLEFWESDNPKQLERYLHQMLESRRVNQNREFFAATLDEVKDLIARYC
jgi:hypothetical protein